LNWNGYLIWKTLGVPLSLVWGVVNGVEAASSPPVPPLTVGSAVTDTNAEGMMKADSDASSVMLSSAELDAIGLHTRRSPSRMKRGDIEEWRLDGIIFRSEDDWVLWLNGEMYTPKDLPQDLEIINVAPDHMDVKLKNQADDKTRRIVLNQKLSLYR